MSEQALAPPARSLGRLSADKPLSIAILAMGGQGGGVLADWIIALAEREGWVAQGTSVPGVAQRTGATIYYIELLAAPAGRTPVLSLMPTPGDVDVVLAAEWMEAGRSVLRGLVTPERTTLIASTHRAYAVVEKQVPGDGAGDPAVVVAATDFAARRTIAFDMERVATGAGSMISAALFGALSAAGVLPFGADAYEAVIGDGRGADASRRAFHAARAAAAAPVRPVPRRGPEKHLPALPAPTGHAALDALLARLRALPDAVQPMAYAGVRRLTDYQDPDYAAEYLDRLATLLQADRAAGGEAHGFAFTQAAAKYLAVAMAYDDVIRVADLKTRASRFARVRHEVAAGDAVVQTTEYMHPRMAEVCGTLPARLGAWIEARPRLFAALDRVVNRGRRVRTTSVLWFLVLYVVAGQRSRRRGTLRHAREMAATDAWLATAREMLAAQYDLGVAVVEARRLVKGYSDTHARGGDKFGRVLSALPLLVVREDGAAWLRRLIRAALQDEAGTALGGALRTVATL